MFQNKNCSSHSDVSISDVGPSEHQLADELLPFSEHDNTSLKSSDCICFSASVAAVQLQSPFASKKFWLDKEKNVGRSTAEISRPQERGKRTGSIS